MVAAILALSGWVVTEVTGHTSGPPVPIQTHSPSVEPQPPTTGSSTTATQSPTPNGGTTAAGTTAIYTKEFTASTETPQACGSGSPVWTYVAFSQSGPVVGSGAYEADLNFNCEASDVLGARISTALNTKLAISSVASPTEADCANDAAANPVDNIYYRDFKDSMVVCETDSGSGIVAALQLVTPANQAINTGVVKFRVTVWPSGQ